jgi:hypothetical protein
MAGREGDGEVGPAPPLGQMRHEHNACNEVIVVQDQHELICLLHQQIDYLCQEVVER